MLRSQGSIVAIENVARNIYGFQYHPEVVHTGKPCCQSSGVQRLSATALMPGCSDLVHMTGWYGPLLMTGGVQRQVATAACLALNDWLSDPCN